MRSQNPTENDPRPATASPADAPAEAEAPLEVAQELTDDELRSINGGAYQTTSTSGAEAAGHEKWIVVESVRFK
jgi:bacteriocin-like protein